MNQEKKRVLTGDRPTGVLHLGHYMGSIKNRVALQDQYDCFFIIADLHTLTTKPQKEHILAIRENVRLMVLDYLACGIDPNRSIIYLQSAIPAVYEMNLFFEMLVSLTRLTGLPTIKDMARDAHMDPESVPFGLIGYPVLQSADILLGRANLVPIGKDNESHIELTRDIARRFNQYYGEVFPLPQALLSDIPTLVGTDGKIKMSKSANNTINLSDEPKIIEKKVSGMYTDPNRIRADVPGTVEGNPVFTYLDIVHTDKEEINDLKNRYRSGTVGDVEVKQTLIRALINFLSPIQERRKQYESEKGLVEKIIYEGTLKMNEIAEKTLKEMKSAMGISGLWNKISRTARENSNV